MKSTSTKKWQININELMQPMLLLTITPNGMNLNSSTYFFM